MNSQEVQVIARKKRVQTCESKQSTRASKTVGFEEFRIVAEKTKMLCFFRKNVD